MMFQLFGLLNKSGLQNKEITFNIKLSGRLK